MAQVRGSAASAQKSKPVPTLTVTPNAGEYGNAGNVPSTTEQNMGYPPPVEDTEENTGVVTTAQALPTISDDGEYPPLPDSGQVAVDENGAPGEKVETEVVVEKETLVETEAAVEETEAVVENEAVEENEDAEAKVLAQVEVDVEAEGEVQVSEGSKNFSNKYFNQDRTRSESRNRYQSYGYGRHGHHNQKKPAVPPAGPYDPCKPNQTYYSPCQIGVIPMRSAAFQAPRIPLPKLCQHLLPESDCGQEDEDGVAFQFKPQTHCRTEVTFTIEPKPQPPWLTMLNCGFKPMVNCSAPPCYLSPNGNPGMDYMGGTQSIVNRAFGTEVQSCGMANFPTLNQIQSQFPGGKIIATRGGESGDDSDGSGSSGSDDEEDHIKTHRYPYAPAGTHEAYARAQHNMHGHPHHHPHPHQHGHYQHPHKPHHNHHTPHQEHHGHHQPKRISHHPSQNRKTVYSPQSTVEEKRKTMEYGHRRTTYHHNAPHHHDHRDHDHHHHQHNQHSYSSGYYSNRGFAGGSDLSRSSDWHR